MAGDIEARVAGFARAVSAGDVAAMRTFLSDDYCGHEPVADEPTQADRWADLVPDVVRAIPDLRVDVVEVHVDDDALVHVVAEITGTHRGSLWGAPPTGRPVGLEVALTMRNVDGRWAVEADASPTAIPAALRELGVIPPPDRMHLPLPNPTVPPEFLLKLAFTGVASDKPCGHLAAARVFEPQVHECRQCVASGDVWPSLRMCLVCGFVGCCDTAVNRHMHAHYEATGHPIFRSIRLTECWIWCYDDAAFFERRTLDRLAATAVAGPSDHGERATPEAGA